MKFGENWQEQYYKSIVEITHFINKKFAENIAMELIVWNYLQLKFYFILTKTAKKNKRLKEKSEKSYRD